ncbi:MAG: T9SS type A sorting domain-containing protein [Chitinophagales bacterium]
MKKLFTLLALIFLLHIAEKSIAQWAALVESEFYGQAYSAVETADGGIVACGWKTTMPEFYAIRTDMYGNTLWETTVSHPDFQDYAYNLMATADGGFIIAGQDTYYAKPYFVKLDSDGVEQWNSSAWSDTISEVVLSSKSALLGDGNIAFIGTHFLSNYFTIYKVSGADGSLLGAFTGDTIAGSLFFISSVMDIVSTADGGFAVTGSAYSTPDFVVEAFLAKYSVDITMEWSALYATVNNAYPKGIAQAADGGLLISGHDYNSAFFSEQVPFILKADGTGMLEWLQYYTPVYPFASGYDVAELADGTLAMIEGGGEYLFPEMTKQAQVYHLEADGELINVDPISGVNIAHFHKIYAASDGGFILTGLVSNDTIVGTLNYFTVIKSGADGSLPDCFIDCVWPGDANNDGVANTDDILALGVVYGTEGPARDDTSIGWYPHYSDTWVAPAIGTDEVKYADSNGDGIIDEADTLAVSLNYGYIHPIILKTAAGEVPLFIDAPDTELPLGPNSLPVVLGDAINYADAIYGIRFTIEYFGEAIDNASVSCAFADGWFGSVSELISFRKNMPDQNKMDVALVRTNQVNTGGYGEIGTVSFVVIDNIAGRGRSSDITFNISNVRAIDIDMNEIAVQGSDVVVETEEATGIHQQNALPVSIYPNPVLDNTIHLQGNYALVESVSIKDLTGRLVAQYEATAFANGTIPLGAFAAGAYMVELIGQGKVATEIILLQ